MEKKSTLLLALGSNDDAEQNMENAKGMLHHLFRGVVFTSCIWTDPINIESNKFLNCMAVAESTHNLKQLEMALKQIEKKCGDSKPKRQMNIVKMDIDVLEYRGVVYHEKDWDRPYIKELLSELKAESEDSEK